MRERDQGYYLQYAEALEHRFSHGVLEELQEYDHFVVWKKTAENKKIPFDPNSKSLARTDDPNTWGNLDQAFKALKTGNYHGIGFVFAEDDPFTGIDIDHCVSKNQGTDGSVPYIYTDEASKLITDFWSYTEHSPSKTGLHIIVQGTIPIGRRKNSVEVYATGRYFTITTNQVKGTPETIEERQPQLDKLYASLATHNDHRQVVPQKEQTFYISEETILKKALNAENAHTFTRLWQGDISGHRSKSEADFTLVLLLLYWTNDDVKKTRRLFLQSELVDEKTLRSTKGSTYLDETIANALRKRHLR
jgi:primase-polymerase (primpol)-like protein